VWAAPPPRYELGAKATFIAANDAPVIGERAERAGAAFFEVD
jgi:hypothetical protein